MSYELNSITDDKVFLSHLKHDLRLNKEFGLVCRECKISLEVF